MKQYLCPVCKKCYIGGFDECPECHWVNDVVQAEYPYIAGTGNHMSLNEAIEAYEKGEEVW